MDTERTYTRSQLVTALQELHERAVRESEAFLSNDEIDAERGQGLMDAVDAILAGTFDEEFGPEADAA